MVNKEIKKFFNTITEMDMSIETILQMCNLLRSKLINNNSQLVRNLFQLNNLDSLIKEKYTPSVDIVIYRFAYEILTNEKYIQQMDEWKEEFNRKQYITEYLIKEMGNLNLKK